MTIVTKNLKGEPTLSVSFVSGKPFKKEIAYDIDSFKLYALIKNTFLDSFFFESLLMPEHQDRYFSIGFSPKVILSATSNTLTIEGEPSNIEQITGQAGVSRVNYHVDNPYLSMQKQFNMNSVSERHQGGLVGYTAYEAVNCFDKPVTLDEHEDFGLFKFGLFSDGLIYDNLTGVLSYYTYDENRINLVLDLLKKLDNYVIPETLDSVRFDGHSETKDEFLEAVSRTQEKICSGYSFQSEVGFKSHYTIKGDKLAVYNRLREVNPSPYMFYIVFSEMELMGASPEILISSHNRDLLTTPTAGTIKRGKTEKEDKALARALLSDPKEIAEHNMLIDLHRNDLSTISNAGTVKITNLMYLIRFSHVQHIVSDIKGVLSQEKDAFDVLSAIMPGGVVTGAPKIETLKIIQENEKTPRGIYGGAVGRFSFNGDCDFCLPIRSLFCIGDRCYAQTSAGIVYDSIPENEYNEVLSKLAAMKQTLQELGEEK